VNKFDLIGFRNIVLPSETELMAKWAENTIAPKVSFICTTYNHESFIEDTIRGFLLQETSFPFEILIHDDASTDNTAQVIKYYSKLYPNIIHSVIQTENQYSRDRHFPIHSMFEQAKGEYIAICEGDDFWICKTKTSVQVSIFERNSKVSLVYGKAYIYRVSENNICSGVVGNLMATDAIYYKNGIPTLTTMFKKSALVGLNDYVGSNQKEWLQSDYQLWLWLKLQGDIVFEDKITSIYRVLTSSASRPDNVQAQYKFRQSVLSVSIYFSERNCSPKTLRYVLLRNHFFLYLWCLKRKLPQAKTHKKQVLKLLGKEKAFMAKIIFDMLIEKILVPTYFLFGGST